jgi:hypothetical protein
LHFVLCFIGYGQEPVAGSWFSVTNHRKGMVEGNWLSGLLMAASYQRIEDLQAIGG